MSNTDKPTLDEILSEFQIHNKYSDGTCFNDGVTHAYIQVQVQRLIADIIGLNESVGGLNNRDGGLPLARNYLRAEQRQRAKERGIDL